MATIKDVAKHAGVSVGTVSMVINGNQSVKMETRFKVLKSIEALSYVPNQYARSLVTKRKRVLGVIHENVSPNTDVHRGGQSFDEIPNTYLADMMDTIAKETSFLGYSLLFDVAMWSSKTDPTQWTLPQIIHPSQIDGCILAGGFMTERHEQMLAQMDMPVVTIGSRYDSFDWVDSNYEKGLYDITRYVLSCGHRNIAFINGLDTTQTSARKLAGFIQATRELGLTISEDRMEKAAFSAISGYNAMQRLWNRGIRPTAVITAMDVVAIGAIHFLHEKGICVPQDVSITGFEDGLLAQHFYPPITTVDIDKNALATQASQIIVHRIDNRNAKPVRLIIQPTLRIRSTVQAL